MSISLSKGGKLSLTKTDPSVRNVTVGLGWKARETDGVEFDLDASVFMLKENDKVRNDNDLIFYNNTSGQDNCIVHTGDDRIGGSGESDDEQIVVHLNEIPPTIQKLVFVVTIHEAAKRSQSFGQIRRAYIRIVNDDTLQEIVKYDLVEDYSSEDGVIFGTIYRKDSEWYFNAEGTGIHNGLAGLCAKYGIEVE